MANTKCPARYKNLGLETFGNKKKVTDELLKQLCKNDEYLYQQIRILLDLTDPESRKRFHPPTFEDEVKSFGYIAGSNNNEPCYKFNDGNEEVFQINFDTSNDGAFRRGRKVYDRDESIIDYDKTGDGINIYVDKDGGHAKIREVTGVRQENQLVKEAQTIEVTTPKTTTKSSISIVADGAAKLDSYCYGPYGSMAPNGWWYVGYDLNKNYSIAPEWWKEPYSEGIPTKCRAQTFVAQNTGWVTQVNLNLKSESNKKSASPFSCEIWETDNEGKPTGGALARVEKSFIHTGGRIESFVFNTKVLITKGKKYAIVMRSPLSYRDSCYRTVGWPRTCYTNYMKGSYFYGAAYQSLDNGKTWVEYCSSSYGILGSSASNTPIAFGFEIFVQPTKTIISEEEVIEYITTYEQTEAEYELVDIPYGYYPKGNHYIYFNIPSTNPISFLHINLTDAKLNGQKISFDVSYNGEDWNNNYHMSDNDDGTGSYDFTSVQPTFVTVRCNLWTGDETKTPEINQIEFIVDTEPSEKAYIRSLPYCPESETMLPACIWSEVNAEFEEEEGTSVKVDIVREIESEQLISIRKDTKEELWSYYQDYYPNAKESDFTDEGFREALKKDTDFINHLKTLEPPVYVICALPISDENYFKYFDSIEFHHYPAYPILSCTKLLNELKLSAKDFYNQSKYNARNTEYTVNTGYTLSKDMVNILFQEPRASQQGGQEGITENVLVEGEDYRIDGKKIIFLLNGENISKNIVKDTVTGQIKCFKSSDGTHDIIDDYDASTIPTGEDIYDYIGEVIKLVINLKDNSYSEHMHFDVDYNNKSLTMKPSMEKDINTCELLITYNPLWVRDLELVDFPLAMDLWVENFVVEDGQKTFDIMVSPRDNLREVVLFDEEDSLTRKVLVEDKDFVVDYRNNTITFLRDIEDDTPITIRYTPNLTDTSLSIAYRLDRTDLTKQAYVYGNYFSTRT